MSKIHKGDKVVVTAGRDKGKQGTVVRVLENDRLVVETINMVKRHTKPNPNKGVTGGIVDQESPIHISNVMLVNPATGKGERLGYKTLEDGRKVRFFRKSGEVADTK
ncbi:MAG: 50S ribosomal protein L24 [Candidatus Muproteobacteria bacterium RBG_16_62_13]|uniref:Large ribosomal subunit protein uL24 n=1 Tax=Candidatus Muproteobacteria bacterium RBG_16_62_13 TaxID=1817756 RepID=A0A1F6T7R7_9PROT|nr:MAG: 50S ribosomal protein L24 [Candidatus Muproteobacteria bacterium RBG_16_62_13]